MATDRAYEGRNRSDRANARAQREVARGARAGLQLREARERQDNDESAHTISMNRVAKARWRPRCVNGQSRASEA